MYFLFCKQIVNFIHSFDNNMFNKFKKNKNKRKMSKYMLYLYSKVKEGSNNQLFLQIYEDKGGVKMKGNKRLLVLAVLLLLVTVTFGTYAIYRSSGSATGTLKAAGWSVKVKGTDIESANFNFGYSDITRDANPGKNNTIAPGATGHIEIPVDATGSEVDVVLTATLGTVANGPEEGFTVTLADGNDSQIIVYSTETDAMKKNVRLNVTWTGTTADETTKDTKDKAAQGKEISIPVTLTARQKVVGE